MDGSSFVSDEATPLTWTYTKCPHPWDRRPLMRLLLLLQLVLQVELLLLLLQLVLQMELLLLLLQLVLLLLLLLQLVLLLLLLLQLV